jgi:hypothetical protein
VTIQEPALAIELRSPLSDCFALSGAKNVTQNARTIRTKTTQRPYLIKSLLVNIDLDPFVGAAPLNATYNARTFRNWHL